MPRSTVPLTTVLDRIKANEKQILASTTTAALPSATTSPPSPPLSPSTRPATSSQLSQAPRAAVLVGLFNHPQSGEVNVLLTLRASSMNSHQGEVALPGGRRDAEDGGDDVRTALREAEEEVGLDRSLAVPCARMRRVFSKKSLVVAPIVASIPVPSYILSIACTSTAASTSASAPVATFTPHLNGSEVAAMFCLPLHTFLSSVDYRYEDRLYDIYTYRMHYFTRRTSEWIEVDPEPPLPPTADTAVPSTSPSTSVLGGSSSVVNWRVAEHEREFLVWGMTASVLVACARVAFEMGPEFAVPPLTVRKDERPASPAANTASNDEGAVSQSNL